MSTKPVEMRLYDSTDEKMHEISFSKTASIYTCGITPYDSSHLGHIATFLYFDVLVRYLRDRGIDVTLVRNVTDLDDPLFERVRTSGENLEELVARNVAQLDDDLDQLGCIPPTHEPYSSHFISEMIEAVTALLTSGHAYSVDGWTYFDTQSRASFPEFDAVRKMGIDATKQLAYSRGADATDTRVKHPLDFVLWKPSAVDEPSFDAPFGAGRPGWHIECSVMAMKLLDSPIDIHGGGDDLIFPHHACEVAQSESLSGTIFVKHFMHVAPVDYQGTKMSKSLGNLVFADEIIQTIGPRCTRMMILSHHYRDGFEHHDDDAEKAQARCARWGEVMATYDGQACYGDVASAVCHALADDLNTPYCLELIDQAVATYSADDDKAEDRRADIKAAKELLGL